MLPVVEHQVRLGKVRGGARLMEHLQQAARLLVVVQQVQVSDGAPVGCQRSTGAHVHAAVELHVRLACRQSALRQILVTA